MSDLISKSTLRKELSKFHSEMGYVRTSEVMQILNKQKTFNRIEIKQCSQGLTPLEELVNMATEGKPYRI